MGHPLRLAFQLCLSVCRHQKDHLDDQRHEVGPVVLLPTLSRWVVVSWRQLDLCGALSFPPSSKVQCRRFTVFSSVGVFNWTGVPQSVEVGTGTAFRNLRDACFNLPDRMSAKITAEIDGRVVYEILLAESPLKSSPITNRRGLALREQFLAQSPGGRRSIAARPEVAPDRTVRE